MNGSSTPHPAAPLPPDSLSGLQAIAEPTRARIVALLGHGEHCVCDIRDALGLSTALVSHHLRVLRSAGILRERHSGRWVFYSLDLDGLARVRASMTALLAPTDAAATACVCSDCGSAADRIRLPVFDVGALGIPRELSS